MSTIRDVLHRRPDLSTFIVHLTKGDGSTSAAANLFAILNGRRIEARSPMGWAADHCRRVGPQAVASQSVVCFSETPLEQVHTLASQIEGRRVRLEPYGVAFTKVVARRKGVNPVWYIDMTPGQDWLLARSLDALRAEAVARGDAGFPRHPAATLLPFVEPMGTWPSGRREFWWEREWRHVGDFDFFRSEIALVIVPEQYHVDLRAAGLERPCIDAGWSLERMIASLAGLAAADVEPFGS